MDEYNQDWDPEIKRYFSRILNTFVVTAVWLLFMSTLGLFLRMGYVQNGFDVYNIVFYGLLLLSFPLLLRYIVRLWRRKD
ncbi:MAG: hypothetical protein M3Q06_05615 [Bacteroidota bacterium]|nr:hypothetical protein [Bacteroidota bacterium]